MTGARWSPLRIPFSQPHQVHLSEGMDQWLGDSPRAAKKAGRNGKTDTNGRPLFDGAGCVHAATPREAGYRFIAIGTNRFGIERRRPLTAVELDTPFRLWHRKDFVRLRRTRRRGLRYASRVRPLLFSEAVAVHRKYGAIMVLEIKEPFPKRTAIAMVNLANRRHQTVWFKTLAHQGLHDPEPGYSMTVAGEKLRTFHAVGAQTALACHGYPVPADVHVWARHIDAFWGANSPAFREAARR